MAYFGGTTQMTAGTRTTGGKIYRNLKWDIQNKFRRPNFLSPSTQERLGAVFRHPSDMAIEDRVLLYALVRGLKPERALEIGTRWGGSAGIICAAMEDNAKGKLIGIDIDMSNFRQPANRLYGRFDAVEGRSPDDLNVCRERVGGQFDFVLIDGLHTFSAVEADIAGVLPHLSPEAHVMFHDAFQCGVDMAINEFLDTHGEFDDLGVLSRGAALGDPICGWGFRVIRRGGKSAEQIACAAAAQVGLPRPIYHPSLRNWDSW